MTILTMVCVAPLVGRSELLWMSGAKGDFLRLLRLPGSRVSVFYARRRLTTVSFFRFPFF